MFQGVSPYLPEIILFLHFIYILFCVGGEGIILIAFTCEKLWGTAGFLSRWIQNKPFRIAHAIAVGIVGVEGLFGVLCPLTIWEYAARRASGQLVESEIPLVSRMVRYLIFYDFPPWVFTLLYVGFALLVIGTYVLIPPRREHRR